MKYQPRSNRKTLLNYYVLGKLFAPLFPTVVTIHVHLSSTTQTQNLHRRAPIHTLLPHFQKESFLPSNPHKSSSSSSTQFFKHTIFFSMDATKNPNLEPLSSSSQKRTHEDLCVKQLQQPHDEAADHKLKRRSSTPPPPEQPEAAGKVESGREKLKRHRVEMSGRVWIPDIWGQEDLLKKWIDSTVFDSSVEKSSIMSAREALIQEGRSTLSIENSC
ncbi:putative protein BIC [Helianthus anomalus]